MKAVIKPKRRNVCYYSEKKMLMIYFRGIFKRLPKMLLGLLILYLNKCVS